MRTLLIFLFVTVVSLIVYNPEMDDFHDYMDRISKRQQFEQERSALITRIFRPDTVALSGRSPDVSSLIMERNSFLLFSTYDVKVVINGDDYPMGHYLGIAGMFFDLGASLPEEAHAAVP